MSKRQTGPALCAADGTRTGSITASRAALRPIKEWSSKRPLRACQTGSQRVPKISYTKTGARSATRPAWRDEGPMRSSLMASQEIAQDKDPDRATVVVHAPLDALSGGDRGCAIERGPVIHPEVAARLSCDARLQVVLHDRKGDPLGIGWAGRNPPPWLMRALRHRDERCTFPGCDLRRFTHAHHITKWPLGPTTLRNLVLVCPFHHKLVHEHHWKVELSKAGAVIWFRPNGRRFDPSVARLQGRLDRAPPGAPS